MDFEPTEIQLHVSRMIQERIRRLSVDAWKKSNTLPSGKMRKNHVPYPLPQEVTDLLELEQILFRGDSIVVESIATTITSGQFQDSFLKIGQ